MITRKDQTISDPALLSDQQDLNWNSLRRARCCERNGSWLKSEFSQLNEDLFSAWWKLGLIIWKYAIIGLSRVESESSVVNYVNSSSTTEYFKYPALCLHDLIVLYDQVGFYQQKKIIPGPFFSAQEPQAHLFCLCFHIKMEKTCKFFPAFA